MLLAMGFMIAAVAATPNVDTLPDACVVHARSDDERHALESLLYSNIVPLCAQYPPPRGNDYRVRKTTTYFPRYRRFTDIAAVGNRLTLSTTDTMFDPPSGADRRSTMAPDAFLRSLRHAGLDRVWTAADARCESDLLLLDEIGSVLEFFDADGYHVRNGPITQTCLTDLGRVMPEVYEVIGDLFDRAAVTKRWKPVLPPGDDTD
jgi:hypothetical protein